MCNTQPLTPKDHSKLEAVLRAYYASDRYKASQKWLRDLVHKNMMKRYTSNAPNPPKE